MNMLPTRSLVLPLLLSSPALAGSGGPDAFGYTWIDSDEPGGPAYTWNDISGTGTGLSLGDDDWERVPFPGGFTFPFYGVDQTAIDVGSNGVLGFDDVYLGLGNTCMPGATTYTGMETLIAVLWDDLNPSAGGDVYWKLVGSAPNRRFIIEWNAVPDFGTTALNHVQAVLFEGGRIELRYQAVPNAGSDATVGIQDGPTLGLGVSCNQSVLHDDLLIRFDFCAGDADGDGYEACDDCDDTHDLVFPGAPEACDGVDSDCDGEDGTDADGDGFFTCDDDCDDTDPAIRPGAAEQQCDGVDNDCNPATADSEDLDGDGSTDCDDCDDADPDRAPTFPEIGCNGIDDDCDPLTPDEGDADGDGVGVCDGDCDDADDAVYPGADEIPCNGIDDDCDGEAQCDSGTPDATDTDGAAPGVGSDTGDVARIGSEVGFSPLGCGCAHGGPSEGDVPDRGPWGLGVLLLPWWWRRRADGSAGLDADDAPDRT